MHPESIARMDKFARLAANMLDKKSTKLLDVGGTGESYKKVFGKYFPDIQYSLLNVGDHDQKSAGIDYMVQQTYNWMEIPDHTFDIVISGQTFEHIEYFWLTLLEMRRVLKPGGWMCIIAPSHWIEHRHPVDTYRFNADGMSALAKFAGLDIMYAGADQPEAPGWMNRLWGDAYLVAQKPEKPRLPEEAYKKAHAANLALLPQEFTYEIGREATALSSSHYGYWEARIPNPPQQKYTLFSNNFLGEYAMHTLQERNPFVICVLARAYNISEIRLFNRPGLEQRNEHMSILLSLDMEHWDMVCEDTGRFGGVFDGRPFSIKLDKPARYIKLKSNQNEFLHLDQVQIFTSFPSPNFIVDE